MSQIKGSDTKPERLVRKYLHSKGFRFRLNDKKLPGKPDLTLRKYSTVIFINGCFWHGHKGCKYFKMPKTRTKWWKDKIEKTKIRDQISIEALNKTGWKSIVIWECQLKSKQKLKTLNNLVLQLKEEIKA